jgi:hypothetical protein
MWVLLVLVLSVAETGRPIAGGTTGGPVTGMVGAPAIPAMQEFGSPEACRRAGEGMDGLLGYAGWGIVRRLLQVRWACVPK